MESGVFLCETIQGKMSLETENYIKWRVRESLIVCETIQGKMSLEETDNYIK